MSFEFICTTSRHNRQSRTSKRARVHTPSFKLASLTSHLSHNCQSRKAKLQFLTTTAFPITKGEGSYHNNSTPLIKTLANMAQHPSKTPGVNIGVAIIDKIWSPFVDRVWHPFVEKLSTTEIPGVVKSDETQTPEAAFARADCARHERAKQTKASKSTNSLMPPSAAAKAIDTTVKSTTIKEPSIPKATSARARANHAKHEREKHEREKQEREKQIQAFLSSNRRMPTSAAAKAMSPSAAAEATETTAKSTTAKEPSATQPPLSPPIILLNGNNIDMNTMGEVIVAWGGRELVPVDPQPIYPSSSRKEKYPCPLWRRSSISGEMYERAGEEKEARKGGKETTKVGKDETTKGGKEVTDD